MKTIVVAIFSLSLCFSLAFAQDTIDMQDGQRFEVKIIEISDEYIQWKDFNNLEGPLYTYPIRKIRRVTFENGRIQNFDNIQSEVGASEKIVPFKNAIKVEALSALSGHIGFNYERSLKDKLGFEIKVGIIGPGAGFRDYDGYSYTNTYSYEPGQTVFEKYQESNNQEKGFFMKAGPKFMFKKKNALRGAYFKPEIIYSQFQADGSGARTFTDSFDPFFNEDYSYTYVFQSRNYGLAGNIGVQALVANRLTVDVNVGLGFSIKDDKLDLDIQNNLTEPIDPDFLWVPYEYTNPNEMTFRYSHTDVGGVAFTAGIALGYAF